MEFENIHEAREALRQAREALQALHTVAEGRALDDTAQAVWDAEHSRSEAAQAYISRTEARMDAIRQMAKDPDRIERGDDTRRDTRTRSPQESARDSAMRVLERGVKAKTLPEYAAEKVETLLTDGAPASRSFTARWAVATGDDAYRSAFAKLCADPERGHLDWTPEEGEAFRQVRAVHAEQRAMAGGTGSTGGYMVPLTLDPSIMLSSSGSLNPLRQISRVVQTATDSWHGVTSDGVTAEWKGEGAQVADASPALAQPGIPVYFGDAFTPYSYEVGMDAPGFLNELQRLLADAADQLMNEAYTTGSGIAQPTGIITSLVDDGSSVIPGTGSEALASADMYALQNALPPRFQARAQWAANLSVINSMRQMETTNGALKFPELASNPPRLLNRAVNECSNMDGTLNAAATENNYVLLYGDFQQFAIVDRIGTTIEFIPNLMGANNRPTGQRGALLWFRTGSKVVLPEAFRLLNVATTA